MGPQAAQDPHDRRFSGAIWAGNQEVLATAHLKRDMLGKCCTGGRDNGQALDVQQHWRFTCMFTPLRL